MYCMTCQSSIIIILLQICPDIHTGFYQVFLWVEHCSCVPVEFDFVYMYFITYACALLSYEPLWLGHQSPHLQGDKSKHLFLWIKPLVHLFSSKHIVWLVTKDLPIINPVSQELFCEVNDTIRATLAPFSQRCRGSMTCSLAGMVPVWETSTWHADVYLRLPCTCILQTVMWF